MAWGGTRFVLAFLVLVAGLAASGCSRAEAKPEESKEWRTDYQAALKEATKAGKPLFLDFSATWCPPCQAMKQGVFPQANVREALLGGFVPVSLDISTEESPNAPVGTRFQVEVLPTMIVVSPEGKVLSRREGYQSAEELLTWLKPLAAHATTQAAAPTTQPAKP